jgi:histidine triad (HIT) family protein
MTEEDSRPADAACLFCAIAAGAGPASVVAADALTLAFLDLRQAHPGHVLVISRRHVADLREADDATAEAVIRMVRRVMLAVDRVFPSDGLSVWHSVGAGANQEVPHLHFHVHPRRLGDGLLRVYPEPPPHPERATLDTWAAQLRAAIESADPTEGP